MWGDAGHACGPHDPSRAHARLCSLATPYTPPPLVTPPPCCVVLCVGQVAFGALSALAKICDDMPDNLADVSGWRGSEKLWGGNWGHMRAIQVVFVCWL